MAVIYLLLSMVSLVNADVIIGKVNGVYNIYRSFGPEYVAPVLRTFKPSEKAVFILEKNVNYSGAQAGLARLFGQQTSDMNKIMTADYEVGYVALDAVSEWFVYKATSSESELNLYSVIEERNKEEEEEEEERKREEIVNINQK